MMAWVACILLGVSGFAEPGSNLQAVAFVAASVSALLYIGDCIKGRR